MHFRKSLPSLILLLCCLLKLNAQGFDRQVFNFNPDWKFQTGDVPKAAQMNFDDANWTSVSLPHAYNQEEAFRVSIEELTTGIVWYRKSFKIPQEFEGKKVFIEFEGIRQGGEIYLNGEKIGLHENGTMAFGFDLSEKIKFGNQENVIALRIDNSWDYRQKSTNATYRWNDKNFNANYGGIPKNVKLHITAKTYQTLPLYSNLQTTGVYVYAKDFNIVDQKARIHAESEVKNESNEAKTLQYEVVLEDADGNEIAKFASENVQFQPGEQKIIQAEKAIENLQFWSWGYGYLYTVKTRLLENNQLLDEVKTQTGFRKTAFRNGMVYLNDRVLQMKGYAQRTSNEWPAVGLSVPPWMSDFSNHLMLESNANLVRWMHTTPWKQDVESCDRLGLIQAMPAGDSEGDSKGDHWKQRTQLMRDAIIYNRNNPSIIFYECGNESISEPHMHEMKSIRNTFDPYGGRAIGSREMLDSQEAEYGGEMLYINHSADIPMWATEYSRDEGLRKYWDEFTPPFHEEGDGPLYKGNPATSYNHNQDAHAIENVVRWFDYFEARPGTGNRVSSGGVNIIFSDSNTHHRGEENYRSSGEVDPMRIPKDNYFVHQVMWNGWVDIKEHSLHILGHWNYKEGTVKNEYVVATGAKVELFLNGKSLGCGKQSHQFLFTFENIQFEPGTLKAVSYDADGNILSESTKKTAGEPKEIRLQLRTAPNGLLADAADIALVDVEVVDKNGNRCPVDHSEITFELSGKADWLGGLADGPNNNILSKKLPVINGINRVMFRSTTEAGKIKLKAKAKGLKSAQITLNSVPFESTNGLSTQFPGADLPLNLERGPTPKTPSYSKKRETIYIANATAGANQKETYHTYDDNELTEWTNDGNINTGWIEYEFAKPVTASQCVIKLTGWRTKTYPIRITAKNQVLFEGETWQSLGYITIPLEKVETDAIKIALIGANTEADAYNEIIEVDPTKELDLYKDKKAADAKGQLRIVEIEFYE
ncbi:Glycosyl hydrolases family 2, TIM barrel domain [Pustulibacterium marinum]|uniref:Glycosyl hydrolases family 2, TIM barrel domain n=1 Tax=Pustulibacterium marinum TaxID=1224947 RepID=A0A1I7FRX2_9FLAO|nr:sugar-binding domain-containing protein [Pustulibacterium marinum]SFU38957.1 Glycosyl hydrolases family 2, TIM barrel domain [Pustulibacterium marinum]